jgi:hypothetical protein
VSEEWESGEERIDESGLNPTQRRLDEDAPDDAPVDASWKEESFGEVDPDAAEATGDETV